jgi:hypothetical protein
MYEASQKSCKLNSRNLEGLKNVHPWLVKTICGRPSGLYGKGYPRGKKTAAGRLGGGLPAGRIRVGHDGAG